MSLIHKWTLCNSTTSTLLWLNKLDVCAVLSYMSRAKLIFYGFSYPSLYKTGAHHRGDSEAPEQGVRSGRGQRPPEGHLSERAQRPNLPGHRSSGESWPLLGHFLHLLTTVCFNLIYSFVCLFFWCKCTSMLATSWIKGILFSGCPPVHPILVDMIYQ